MIKTTKLYVKLKEIIEQALSDNSIAATVYKNQTRAKDSTYVVFTCEEVTRMDGQITCELEINCLDYGTDTSTCELMADAITDAFDHKTFITDDIGFNTYVSKRNTVASEDVQVIRRRLTFDLYLYERG